MSEDAPQMRLSEMFDKAYYEPWTTRKKNVVIKGSKGSGKSKWAALWIIYNMMKYRDLMPSTLVVRKFKESIKDSIYAELKWAINQFHVESLWKCNISPMEMVFLPTGQKILFRGMDDPLKVASISVEKGSLCWVLWEEASQITNEEDFNTINMSIRGKLPPGLWKRVMIIFNPWSEKHWLKARFFDNPDPDTLALTTTYKNNPFLSEENLKEYEDLRIRSPRAARVICDGDWGIAGGLVFEDWEEADFDINVIRATYPGLRFSYGLDFGFVNDPTAFVAIAVDELSRQIWIFDEMYEYGWDNLKIARKLTRMGYADKVIVCDSAEQKSIYELKRGYQTPAYDDNGDPLMDVDGHQLTDTWILPNAEMAMKGPDSVRNGIRDLQSYHIIIHRTKCKNAIIEFNNYAFEEDKDGNLTDKPMDVFNHCLAAGTMIATDHGNVPIEDVQVGDMVLTHLGYRKVLASGITRPEPAEIWKATFSDGTSIEGTYDHNVMTTEGYINIGCLSIRDKVIQWEGPLEMTLKASASYMTDTHGTDILVQNQEIRACISEELQIQNPSICTDISGRNIMAQFLLDMKSITSMEIPTITIFPILNVLPTTIICRSTPVQRSKEKSDVKPCSALNLHNNVPARRGTHQQKVMNGMFSMERKLQRASNQSSMSASIVGRSIWPNHLMEDSVQMLANLPLAEHPASMTRIAFAQYVAEYSKSTNTKKPRSAPLDVEGNSILKSIAQNCNLQSVIKVERTGRHEYVYDLTVDEAHDFFANGILVSNCMDSLRYAKSKLMGKGKGLVIETGESPVITSTEPHTIKRLQPCSRVYSTYDDESRLLSGPTTSDGIPLSLFNQASQKEAER